MVMELPEFKGEAQEFYAEWYTMVQPGKKWRLRTAWQVFRGRDNYLHDIALGEEGLHELKDFLNETIKAPV